MPRTDLSKMYLKVKWLKFELPLSWGNYIFTFILQNGKVPESLAGFKYSGQKFILMNQEIMMNYRVGSLAFFESMWHTSSNCHCHELNCHELSWNELQSRSVKRKRSIYIKSISFCITYFPNKEWWQKVMFFLLKPKNLLTKKDCWQKKGIFLNMKYLKRALKMKETHIGKKKRKRAVLPA